MRENWLLFVAIKFFMCTDAAAGLGRECADDTLPEVTGSARHILHSLNTKNP